MHTHTITYSSSSTTTTQQHHYSTLHYNTAIYTKQYDTVIPFVVCCVLVVELGFVGVVGFVEVVVVVVVFVGVVRIEVVGVVGVFVVDSLHLRCFCALSTFMCVSCDV